MKFRFYAFKLSLLMVLFFVLQVFFSSFTDTFVLDFRAFGEYWRFLSSIFLHGGLGHLAYNLFALLLFGSVLEKVIGGKKFLLVFFLTGIFANLISINFYSSSLGASGAIFGIIGTLIIVRPWFMIWAFGMPMPLFIAGILWAFGDFIGAVSFFSGNAIDNTGNIAHLSGMLLGFVFGLFYRGKVIRRRKMERVRFREREVRDWENRNIR